MAFLPRNGSGELDVAKGEKVEAGLTKGGSDKNRG